MERKSILGAAILAAAVAGVAGVRLSDGSAHGSPPSPPNPFDRVSASGPSVAATGRAAAMIRRLETDGAVGQVKLISKVATRQTVAFYRITGSTGHGCYAAGSVSEIPAVVSDIGVYYCPAPVPDAAPFPSRDVPVANFSIVSVTSDGESRLLNAQGFAADGVREVAATDRAGTVLTRVTVVNNVFFREALPSAAVRLIGLDAAGAVVWQQSV